MFLCRPCSYLTASMLCSRDQLCKGSWDRLAINSTVDRAQTHNTGIRQIEQRGDGECSRKWEEDSNTDRRAIIPCACWNALCGMRGIKPNARLCRMLLSQLACCELESVCFGCMHAEEVCGSCIYSLFIRRNNQRQSKQACGSNAHAAGLYLLSAHILHPCVCVIWFDLPISTQYIQ